MNERKLRNNSTLVDLAQQISLSPVTSSLNAIRANNTVYSSLVDP